MMEKQVDGLVDKVWAKYLSTPPTNRLMIAVGGIPGSGKTSLVTTMANRINALHALESPNEPPISTCVPMDGYHFTRAELAAMPDPVNAVARRGAAFTFDPDKFLKLVKMLREPLTSESKTVYAPSFDHAVKDPVEDDIPIPASARVIFFEGNYVCLDKEPWAEAARLMDELWFVDVGFETARKRLVKRHVEAGIAKDEEAAEVRVRDNDLVNGREILDYRLDMQEVISSVEDNSWK